MKNDNKKPASVPDEYYYLWHLVSLGVITPDEKGEGFADTLWDRLSRKGDMSPSCVVLIDVGCNFAHPNLKTRVDPARSIDFTGSPFGTRLKKDAADPDAPQQNFQGLDTSALVLEGLPTDDLALFEEVVQHLEGSSGRVRRHGDVEALFSSHGTAVSGLIVGGPEVCPAKGEPTEGVMPYFGVDPFSHLVSVRTGFDNDPLQFIAALLYAWHQNPDVIVMPRGLPDPDHSNSAKDDFKANLESWVNREAADLHDRIQILKENAEPIDPSAPQTSANGRRLWRIVQALLVAISKHVPVVCAAGNEGESQLLYPANLANRENGIIAVGAVSGNGYRSGYANYGEGLTVVAPSDDMTVFNRHQIRGTEKSFEKHGYLKPDEAGEYPYCNMGLLSTDIGGRFGYDTGSGSDDEVDDENAQDGYYTLFGGTSGACALVGGVVALLRRGERLAGKDANRRDGRDIKSLLSETARCEIPVGADLKPLRTDSMNAFGEDAAPPEFFFGAGLVDAKAALDVVLK
ncbi:S8 family serine peptidase [Ruegeria sp. HKCCD8929]|uniref:S8 family serine peptidase n=1 Tax=Ruegeria sp. HKCCD8929 TaxID=2683006 RepID=UPI00148834C6|nr:S8 family serine peptidase [Ruegeria sp. HKCCD8929]